MELIGSWEYFREKDPDLNEILGIFTDSSPDYGRAMKSLAGRTEKILEQILEDLQQDVYKVRNIPSGDRDRLCDLVMGLCDLFSSAVISPRARLAYDIASLLKSPPERESDAEARQEKRQSPFYRPDTAGAANETTLPAYMIMSNALVSITASAQNAPPVNFKGHTIASPRYIAYAEEWVFDCGADAMRRCCLSPRQYGETVRRKLQNLADRMLADALEFEYEGNPISADRRDLFMQVARALDDAGVSINVWVLQRALEGGGRLRGFDGKVIKINVSGPIDARLDWDQSSDVNTLQLRAKIRFIYEPKEYINAVINAADSVLFIRLRFSHGIDFKYLDSDIVKLIKENQDIEQILKAQMEKHLEPSIQTRINEALAGFQRWDNGGNPYTVFDGQKLIVKMTIEHSVGKYQDGYVNVLLLPPIEGVTSFGWGGTSLFENFQPLPFLPEIPVPVGIFGWNAGKTKVMGLLEGDGMYHNETMSYNTVTAMHEFGHILGLQDAYKSEAFFPLHGVDMGKYSDAKDSVMFYPYDFNPTNNDIEMVVLAFATGKRQNYQKQFWFENISEALGRGD